MKVQVIENKDKKSAKSKFQKPKFDIERIRSQFPILGRSVYGKSLVYLDNAATTQKPKCVIDAIRKYYEEENANVHRGVHFLSETATKAFEEARQKIQKFINAKDDKEIIFTRGTTEGINLVAQTYGRNHVQKGDEVLISELEHHSNIVPWQILCDEKGAKLVVAPINDRGEIILSEYEKRLSHKTKIVAISNISNALGTVNPIQKMIRMAHDRDIPVLIDGAQAAAHLKVDVQALDCDFYTLSAHKIYGPTGIGVLYGKAHLLAEMPPYQGGGDMIRSVTFEKTIYNTLPFKFEAGTPNIVGAIGFGVAIDYLNEVGIENVATYENDLLRYATEEIEKFPQVRLIGTAEEKACVISFVIEGIHPHDIGTILDRDGIAIRTGHHCAQPVMAHYNVPATARVSLACYNTREDIDRLIAGLKNVIEVLG